jgi:hypothetical protein
VLTSKFRNIINNTPKKICVKLNETFKARKNVQLLTYNNCSSSQTKMDKIENKRQFNNESNQGFQQNTSYAIPNPLFISTPNEEKKKISLTYNSSFYKIKQPSFDDDVDVDDEIEINSVDLINNEDKIVDTVSEQYIYNSSDVLDESTQVNINAPPKLIESTFNSSSISNMSNDLIILQHVYQKQNQIKMKEGSAKRYANF